MSRETGHPAPPVPVSRPRPLRRRAASLSVVALALILAFLAAYAPALLGRWILLRVTEDVQATSIGGPLWRPVLHGTQVRLPGITAQAERLGVGLAGFDLRRRVLYVSVDLRGAEVALELAELFGQGEDAITTEEGWKVQLRQLTVSDTALKVNGEQASVPDGTFQVTQARDGGLLAQGRTADGEISAHLRFRQGAGGTEYVTNFQADARVLRYYWEGVEEGTVTGEYLFGQGPVRGQLQLSGGRIRVPEADWAEVDSISGSATHLGDLIQVQLKGEGYGKPVTAVADVNLAAQQWKVRLAGTPQLDRLAGALGTGGKGEARLTAQAHNLGPGWKGVEVVAQANSRAGTLAGIPFERLANEYRYVDRDGDSQTRPELNRWRLGADTGLLGERQRLNSEWNFGGTGKLSWRGALLDTPLDLSASIARETLEGRPADFATIAGTALGGPAQGRVALSGRVIEVRLNPELDSLSGTLALSGRAGDLRLSAQGVEAGGFALDGEARFSEAGTVARLRQPGGGTLNLDLDSEWRGEWQAQNLSGSGVTLSGRGGLDVPAAQLSGQLGLSSGLLERTLSGPLNLNWDTRQARWDAGGQSLRWNGERILADLRDLRLNSGIRLDGSLNASLSLDDLRGTLRGQGEGFSVTASGEGDRVRWQGTLGQGRRVALSGLTQLDEGFATAATLSGADVSADVRVRSGLSFDFDLRTAGERAAGTIDGENWDAQGRVNLGALRPVLGGALGPDSPLADLSGTLDLNLRGQGGTARVQARAAGAALASTLRRQAGTVTAERLRASGGTDGPLAGFSAVASGEVYPSVNLRGPVTLGPLGGVQGLAGQTLQGRLYGDYGALNAALNGQTAPLSAGGVRLPAQTLALGGRLTPTPDLSGRWGSLDLRYRSGIFSVSGTQALTVQGRAATVRGRASWGQGQAGQSWQGQADLNGSTADGYALAVRGPWNALRVTASHPDGLRAAGTVNAPRQSYDLAVSGRAPLFGNRSFGVQGRVRGQGLNPRGTLTLTDGQGGRAFLTLSGLDNLTVRAEALQLGGQTLSGNLRSVDGLADGQLTTSAHGQTLTLQATRGRVNVSGVVQNHRVQASGQLRLPGAGGALRLSGLRLNVNGPYVAAQAAGSLESLRGQVTLKAQQFGEGDAVLILPQQTLPLSASLTPLRATVGGLTYAGGRWSGNTSLSYLVRTRGAQAQAARGGQVQLRGSGQGLTALSSGALAGRVALLPTVGGTLSADTALLRPLLPAELQDLRGGRVQATFTAQGARLSTPGVRYRGQALSLNAQVDWGRGFSPGALQASGVLTTGRSRLPFQLRGGALTLTGARVDARDVRPLLGTPLSGKGQPLLTGASFRGNLFVPDIGDFSLNTLGVRGVLTSGHSQAPLTLRGGTLTLEDALLDVRDVRPFVPAATRLPADGTFRGDLRLTDLAHFSLANVQAQGVLASGRSRAPLSLRRGALRVTGGVLDVRDLRPLVDDPASLPAGGTFQGDLYVPDLNKFDLQHVRARGVLASGASRLPLDIRNDTLRVSGGVLNVNDVRRWLDPELREKLPGSATFRGDLTLRNLGDFAPENLNVRGVLDVGNSRLPLTLAGRALTVTGGRLDLADVQPYLDLPARGVLRGDLYLPDVLNPDLNTVRADLVTGGLTATNLADTSAQGRLRLRGGQLWADLSGQVQGQPLTLRGDVYPRANATLRSEELTARLSGHAEGTLNFSAAGEYQGRAVAVQGTLNGLLAEGRAARAALSGTVSGAQLDLTLNEASTAWEDWRVSGSLLVPDARTLDPGLSGSLSGSVGGTLGRADLRVQGTVNDIALNVPATFSGGELRVREAQAGSAELGTATLSGLAFPRLNLSGAAQLRGDLAGSYRLNVSGDYSAPTARLDGQLAGESGSVHPSGLNIGGTGVTATLQEGRWQAQLSGPAVRGTVSGVLGAQVAGQDTPLGLQRADLNLNARYRRDGDDLTLSGPLAWNGAAGTAGWRGNVNVRGTLGGERLSAQATGTGPLSVTARLGDASLRAELGRLAPVRPEGWVATERWDVGALWGRPEQLRLTGRADLAGPDWQSVQARLSGQLDDVTGELSGTLSGEWTQAQGGTFALSGPRVQANGTLRGGRYTVDARLGEGPQGTQVGLARLLPAEWGITALKASGSLSVRGSLTGGVEQLDASGLEVNGEQQGAGPFTLYGRASYRPHQETLDAALAGGYGGGIFRIGGSLPQGLNVQVANVSLAAFASENFDPGRLNGEATLRGPLSRAALSGTLHTTGGNVDAAVDLLGRLDDPRVQARLNLRGEQSGELTLSARDFDLPGRTFAGELRGQVRQGDTVADLDLRGQWPRLGGQVRVQDPELAQPFTLRGQHGQFTLDPGVAGAGSGSVTLAPGAGWLPTLTAQADLNPLALLPGASGEARLRLNAGGELNALTVQGTLSAPAATLAGVTVRNLNGTFGGPLNGGLTGLSGELTQRGQAVGTLAGGRLNLSGLRAEAAGSTLALSGPVALDTLNAALTADVSGSLSGELRLNYAGGRLSSSGTLEGLGYRAALDVQGSQESGWSGTVTARDIQGAPEVLTTPATLTVSGPWNTPRLRGTLGLLNAAATLEASPDGAALTLADGVTAKGSGTLRVAPDPAGVWRWTGAASVDSPRLRLSVTPRGELADPLVGVAAGRGTWQATGSVSRAAGRLSVSDGERQGRLDWQGQVLSADLPGLDLAGLRWRGLAGRLSAQGTVNLGSDAVAGGALPFRIDGLRSPWRVDALNLPLSGDVSGTLRLEGGRPSVQAQAALGSEGTAQGQATLTATQQPGGKWFGRLQGRLQQGSGTLSADVRSDAAGLTGQVQATGYPVTLQEQTLALNGAARLNGQTFSADLNLDGVAGEASLSGGGSLGAALPALTGLTALEDTGAGYTLTGTLGGVDLGQLGLVPDLSGTVSGELDITDGAGQFVLRSADLNLAGEALPSRFEGVLVGQDWRIRGYLGDTDIFAGVSGGVLSGNAELQGLPLGAVANALAGQRLADGRVTGVARFEAPLADPLAGRATVVAERIRLTTLPSTEGGETAESETLTGSGSLDFQNRELRSINVQLGGAGSWDIRGQYTRERVDVRANFTETTFTPLLALIPSLAEQSPRLKGSLNVAVLGDYGQPVGTLDARNLRGSLAGVSLEVPALTGRLDQSGRWTLGGGVRTGGALDSAGTLQGSGLWRDWQLSESALNYSGQLSPGSAVGTLSGVQATLSQNRTDPERWVLDARSVSRNATTGQGLLEVRGQLIPAWDLSVRATNYDLALPGVFLRESALNGALTLRHDPGSEDIRVRGSADFARAVLGRPDAADNLDALVPSPEQPRSEDGAPDNFVSPLPKQYTTFPQPEAAADAGTEPSPPALPLLERLILEDIPVSFSGGIQLQESLAQAELGGSLRLSGTGARPHIAGHLSGQRGTLLLRDTEFALRNLDIDFSGTSPYPTFNLLAEGRVRPLTGGAAVPVTLDVQGSFLEDGAGGASLDLKTALRCTEQTAACNDPQTGQPYTESQLYALVLTGVPNVENLPENLGSLGASALNTALNVFVLGELSRNLADALGVDVLRFTPALVGEGGATITIGSQLTENLYLEYQVDLRGEGLINAAYNTPDGRFTFKVSTEFDFGESKGFRPSVSAGYNINERTSVAFNIENTSETNRFSVGVQYRLPSNFWKRER